MVTAAAVRAAFSKGYFNRCLSMAEKVVVVVDGLAVLLRVQVVNDKTAEEQAMEAVSNHCHRGALTDDTEVYIVAEKPGDGVGLRTLVPLEVTGAAARPSFEGAGDDDELHPAEIRVVSTRRIPRCNTIPKKVQREIARGP